MACYVVDSSALLLASSNSLHPSIRAMPTPAIREPTMIAMIAAVTLSIRSESSRGVYSTR